MQVLKPSIESLSLSTLCLKRQTQMYCMICENIAESYSQKECYQCGSICKWSIPWKNENDTLQKLVKFSDD